VLPFIEITQEILYVIFYRTANIDGSRNRQLSLGNGRESGSRSKGRTRLGEASKATVMNHTKINNNKK